MNIRQLLERGDQPFPSHPQVKRFFASASIEEARRRLGSAIERGDGAGVVIGSAGTGKSLLLQALAASYRDRFDVVLLACAGLCTRRALLQAILFELGLDYHVRDEGELRLSLLDQLLSGERDSTGLLLMVDEAQLLPPRLLEELRMLTNVAQSGSPRVRLVLAGLPALEEVLASPELESFSQRVAARCYLGPFNREETIQYVRAQVAASDGDPDQWFAADAWQAIFEATDGVPRLVNQLCSRAISLADAESHDQVDRSIVQAAWSELQQLPTPWEGDSSSSPSTDAHEVVEFGNLDDAASFDGGSAVSLDEELEDEPWSEPAETTDWCDQPIEESATSPAAAQEIDDAPIIAAERKSANRPTRAAAARETVDPFAEPFDDEEVVLDNFATWDSEVHAHSAFVENRRDHGFMTVVQQALNASAAKGKDMPADDALPTPSPSSDHERPVDVDPPNSKRPRVRLAMVPEPAPLKPLPVVTSPASTKSDATASLPEPPEQHEPRLSCLSDADPSDDEQDILVVEEDVDESAETASGVLRQQFGQLFSRLRGH